MDKWIRCTFSVKQYNGGKFWVLVEMNDEDVTDLPELKNRSIGFEVLRGISYEKASKIQQLQNENLTQFIWREPTY